MPYDLGYFHPDRQSNSPDDLDWLEQNDLLRRTANRYCVELYEDAAKAIDGDALVALNEDLIADSEGLEVHADKLRHISRALRHYFTEHIDAEQVTVFVDGAEAEALRNAESRWIGSITNREANPSLEAAHKLLATIKSRQEFVGREHLLAYFITHEQEELGYDWYTQASAAINCLLMPIAKGTQHELDPSNLGLAVTTYKALRQQPPSSRHFYAYDSYFDKGPTDFVRSALSEEAYQENPDHFVVQLGTLIDVIRSNTAEDLGIANFGPSRHSFVRRFCDFIEPQIVQA